MNILLLDPLNRHEERFRELVCTLEEATLLPASLVGSMPSESLRVDVIIAVGDVTSRGTIDALLTWRTHPHTYLVPCWITSDFDSFRQICLWPRLAIDRFDERLDPASLCDWLNAVSEWQQNRMHLESTDSLGGRGVLELATSLALRKATGRLAIYDEEGGEGSFHFKEGHLLDARIKHLRGTEAFCEFLSLVSGSYSWESGVTADCPEESQGALQFLIEEGLRLMRDANLLYHFTPHLQHCPSKTGSESALDDGAVAFFAGQKEVYGLIDGKASFQEIIEASPLSYPRTMIALAKWLSLQDITITASTPSPHPKHRLLIVDDSQLMCKALSAMFSDDSRFEIIGVAHDGLEALALIEERKPDVVTLDIQMPRMDGLTALKHIMIREPKPVVVLSSFTKETSQLTYETFKYGAVDVCTKPAQDAIRTLEVEARELLDRVAQASCVRLEAAQYIRRPGRNGGNPQAQIVAPGTGGPLDESLILVVCGPGGFPSFLKLLFSLPASTPLPPIIAAMAMSKHALEAFVPHMVRDCGRQMLELAPPGIHLSSGVSFLSARDHLCRVVRESDGIRVQVEMIDAGSSLPFDTLLRSTADVFGSRAAALLISGTGEDGVEGMRYALQKGVRTWALAPHACLKAELPRQVLAKGYAQEVGSTAELARWFRNPLETLLGSAELVIH